MPPALPLGPALQLMVFPLVPKFYNVLPARCFALITFQGYEIFRKLLGPPGVLGIWGEWLFIFRYLGITGNYFRRAGEQAHSFGDLGSPAEKQKKIKKNKGKLLPPFCLIF